MSEEVDVVKRWLSSASILVAGLFLLSACVTAVPRGDAPSSPDVPSEYPPPTSDVTTADAQPTLDVPNPDDPGLTDTDGMLAGTAWVLESMGGEPPLDDTTITLRFTPDGRLQGSAGCNYFGGDFTEEGDEVTVEPLAVTLMGCPDPMGSQENSFLKMLQESTGYAIDGEQLTLLDDEGLAQLVFLAQSQELAGSTWVVDGYNDGAQGIVSVLEGTTAEVSFGENGTISGTGGCNRLMGDYTAEDGDVGIGPLAMTRMACPEPAGLMEQETALVKALESAATYRVEGDMLHLTTTDGETAATLTSS